MPYFLKSLSFHSVYRTNLLWTRVQPLKATEAVVASSITKVTKSATKDGDHHRLLQEILSHCQNSSHLWINFFRNIHLHKIPFPRQAWAWHCYLSTWTWPEGADLQNTPLLWRFMHFKYIAYILKKRKNVELKRKNFWMRRHKISLT